MIEWLGDLQRCLDEKRYAKWQKEQREIQALTELARLREALERFMRNRKRK